MIYLAVMIGGGLGSLLRFLISSFGFLPFATVFINIIGSLILGFLTFFFLDRHEIPPELRFGLTAGFCGGFTTFSTFSVEVYAMVSDNHIGSSLLCFGQFFRRPARRCFRRIFSEELLTRFQAILSDECPLKRILGL